MRKRIIYPAGGFHHTYSIDLRGITGSSAPRGFTMAKAVKLADIAERVGVSSVTVSKALSDQPGVSNEMRNRIKQLARELGYTSPTEAKLKKISRSFNIGVIISEKYFDNAHSFYWQMYQEVATKAVSKGSFTMLEIIPADMEKSLTLPKLISEKKVDGLVIIGTSTTQYFDMKIGRAHV